MKRMNKNTIGIIGLGYIGLPLAVEFSKAGFKVIGIDIDDSRIKMANDGKSFIKDVKNEDLRSIIKNNKFRASKNFNLLKNSEAVIICVPTPLGKNEEPDLSAIEKAADKVAATLQKGQLIVLESTSYPGTTREILLPRLEASGLKAGKDFFLAFAPERIDPGNKKYTIKDIPKVVGGLTGKCTKRAKELYSRIILDVHTVSSPEAAEAEKLLENIFRSVNIALVNETAILCKKMGIDIWEVIEAAKTKPYGFMAFHPGPGIGGHCIPTDPFYLAWKAKEFNFNTHFIHLAGEINNNMPKYVVEIIQDSLNKHNKSIKSSKILILGVSYKKDIADLRESPALKVISFLENKRAEVFYNDPYIHKFKLRNKSYISKEPLSKDFLKKMDCIVILTDHSTYNFNSIVENSNLIIDTRNATKNINNKAKIVKI
jgi:UDP-N-acetyl-D-glucosamine dehydrogenase